MIKKKRKRFSQSALLAHFKARCRKCGTRESLTTHHRNGDPSDDSLRNLEILCITCHRRAEGTLYKKRHYR